MLARRELWLRARRADSARGLAAVDDFVAQLRETEARRLAEIHGCYDTAALAREFHGCTVRNFRHGDIPPRAALPRGQLRIRLDHDDSRTVGALRFHQCGFELGEMSNLARPRTQTGCMSREIDFWRACA